MIHDWGVQVYFVCEDTVEDGREDGEGSESEGEGDGTDTDDEAKKACLSKHLPQQTDINAAMFCRWIYER